MGHPVLHDRWLDTSGGLGYHWRAWRYRQRLWWPFVAQMGDWLRDWRPPCETLVLIGPSAGYALNAGFLHTFERCVMLEPDPLARRLLRRRFPAIEWHCSDIDVFADDGLAALQQRFPAAAVLFCNVIGQALDADDAARWRDAQCAALKTHDWASWHDVFSSSTAPTRLPAPDDTEACADAAEVAARVWAGQGCRVADHGTFRWLPGERYALWHLAPDQWHVIGWVTHAAETPSVTLEPAIPALRASP